MEELCITCNWSQTTAGSDYFPGKKSANVFHARVTTSLPSNRTKEQSIYITSVISRAPRFSSTSSDPVRRVYFNSAEDIRLRETRSSSLRRETLEVGLAQMMTTFFTSNCLFKKLLLRTPLSRIRRHPTFVTSFSLMRSFIRVGLSFFTSSHSTVFTGEFRSTGSSGMSDRQN
ncbi:Hypothetical protein NTJ_14973 [Nesidiocoris tenuis]|uniref:Uncharacterized protein n=1 Tax=Nesidiocoris tenuis TaxID=355587 RepID=A0ABN7BCX3_9HEMI|nr:Hypothetical protein NTJ_14973 [Nesidiocoris tenuis]